MSHTLEDQKLKYLEELLEENESTLKKIKELVKKRNIALLKYYRDKYIINTRINEILKEERERLSKEGAYSEELLNQKVNKRLLSPGTYRTLVRHNPITRRFDVITNFRNLKELQESIEQNIRLFLEQHGDEKELQELSKPLSEKDYLELVELEQENNDYEKAKKNVSKRSKGFLSRFTRRKGGKKNKNKNKTLKKRKMNKKK